MEVIIRKSLMFCQLSVLSIALSACQHIQIAGNPIPVTADKQPSSEQAPLNSEVSDQDQ
ncbi:hypothetical protein [Psychrobacter sp. FDAARGOS_221]|uniref:hypothetical protein n=1 Tax=Psychrobacter sp. FDAARGOS_221 TaxID=1975705 RepID=UPI00187D36B5|nr:hypothetical protein [Psychrobacter sp. FDAARGOS_221]